MDCTLFVSLLGSCYQRSGKRLRSGIAELAEVDRDQALGVGGQEE